jgi:hypothetical protein
LQGAEAAAGIVREGEIVADEEEDGEDEEEDGEDKDGNIYHSPQEEGNLYHSLEDVNVYHSPEDDENSLKDRSAQDAHGTVPLKNKTAKGKNSRLSANSSTSPTHTSRSGSASSHTKKTAAAVTKMKPAGDEVPDGVYNVLNFSSSGKDKGASVGMRANARVGDKVRSAGGGGRGVEESAGEVVGGVESGDWGAGVGESGGGGGVGENEAGGGGAGGVGESAGGVGDEGVGDNDVYSHLQSESEGQYNQVNRHNDKRGDTVENNEYSHVKLN